MSIINKEKEEKFRKNKTSTTPFISEEEYLERELLAETKSEYDNGKIVAMAGAQPAHNQIVSNLQGELYICLRDSDCTLYPSDMLVHLPECTKYVFPDLTITCEELVFAQKNRNGLKVLTNPQIVIEVSSKSTEGYDLGEKMKCYLKLKSLKEYIIVSTKQKLIIIYTKNKKGEIRTKIYDENDKELKIGECKIDIDRIYRKVGFEQNENQEENKTEKHYNLYHCSFHFSNSFGRNVFYRRNQMERI